jgi:hypothetical protein
VKESAFGVLVVNLRERHNLEDPSIDGSILKCHFIHLVVCLMTGPKPLQSELSTWWDLELPPDVSILSFLKVIQ